MFKKIFYYIHFIADLGPKYSCIPIQCLNTRIHAHGNYDNVSVLVFNVFRFLRVHLSTS